MTVEDELEDGEEAVQRDLELKAETTFKGRFSFSFTAFSCRSSPSTSQSLTMTRSPPGAREQDSSSLDTVKTGAITG